MFNNHVAIIAVMLCLVVTPTWAGVTVTPSMLDVERNPLVSLEQAISALDKLPPTDPNTRDSHLTWQLQATFAAAMLGNQDGYKHHLALSQELAKDTKNVYAIALLTALDAGKAGERGKAEEAVKGANKAALLANSIEDPLSRAFVSDMVGWAFVAGQEYSEAEPHFRFAIDAYTKSDVKLRLAAAKVGIATLYEGLNDLPSAYMERQSAFTIISDMDAPYLKAYVTWSLGKDALRAGEPEKAKDHFAMSVEQSKRMENLQIINLAAQQGMGIAAVDLEQWDEGVILLTEAQSLLLEKGYMSIWVIGQVALARAQIESGMGNAEATLAEAAPYVATMKDSIKLIWYLEREAGVMLALNRPNRAADLLRKVLKIERKLFTDSRQKQLSELMVRYDVYKKQVENSELRIEKELAEVTMQRQQSKQYLLVTILVFGAVVFALTAWTLRQQMRSRRYFSELALTDVLTGSPNRRAILEHLEVVLENPVPSLICILDIDHFKEVNDEHGHLVGDLILKNFYNACIDDCDNNEKIGRLGGEEWLLITTVTDQKGIQALFDRIRHNFHLRAKITLPNNTPPTFSMGVCKLTSNMTVSQCLADADRAMYAAKADGRDRWVYFQ